MRKIICYIASSLDGKIADQHGGVGWLDEIPNPDKTDYGYADFFASIDTILMGNKTYQQVLGFDIGNPYKGKTNYVFTRDKSLTKDDYVTYISENIIDFIRSLKLKTGKNIWLVGGGELNSLLIDHGLLDEIYIFIMPVMLGEGIPLTSSLVKNAELQLIGSNKYNSGVMELKYQIKKGIT